MKIKILLTFLTIVSMLMTSSAFANKGGKGRLKSEAITADQARLKKANEVYSKGVELGQVRSENPANSRKFSISEKNEIATHTAAYLTNNGSMAAGKLFDIAEKNPAKYNLTEGQRQHIKEVLFDYGKILKVRKSKKEMLTEPQRNQEFRQYLVDRGLLKNTNSRTLEEIIRELIECK